MSERNEQLKELSKLALDCMAVAVTIIDPNGTMIYYNQHSAKILDRKPEYIGTDIHSHHKMPGSNGIGSDHAECIAVKGLDQK